MNAGFVRIAICISMLSAASVRAAWLTDYNAALQQARDEGKLVLINFTGSDWCGWCIRLKSEVFEKPEFASFANANFVLLEVDFPRRKAQTEQQRINNGILQNKYRIEGYPTLVVASDNGRPMHLLGYVEGGPSAFITELKRTPGATWKEPSTESSAPTARPPAAKTEEKLWGGLTFPTKRYDELKLTGLSGSSTRRLAIINNQTFAAGETARVKLKQGEVQVLCKEIRSKSVVVQVEGAGEAKELVLGAN